MRNYAHATVRLLACGTNMKIQWTNITFIKFLNKNLLGSWYGLNVLGVDYANKN